MVVVIGVTHQPDLFCALALDLFLRPALPLAGPCQGAGLSG